MSFKHGQIRWTAFGYLMEGDKYQFDPDPFVEHDMGKAESDTFVNCGIGEEEMPVQLERWSVFRMDDIYDYLMDLYLCRLLFTRPKEGNRVNAWKIEDDLKEIRSPWRLAGCLSYTLAQEPISHTVSATLAPIYSNPSVSTSNPHSDFYLIMSDKIPAPAAISSTGSEKAHTTKNNSLVADADADIEVLSVEPCSPQPKDEATTSELLSSQATTSYNEAFKDGFLQGVKVGRELASQGAQSPVPRSKTLTTPGTDSSTQAQAPECTVNKGPCCLMHVHARSDKRFQEIEIRERELREWVQGNSNLTDRPNVTYGLKNARNFVEVYERVRETNKVVEQMKGSHSVAYSETIQLTNILEERGEKDTKLQEQLDSIVPRLKDLEMRAAYDAGDENDTKLQEQLDSIVPRLKDLEMRAAYDADIEELWDTPNSNLPDAIRTVVP
ncbi:hypothetical protein BJ508DRAFT_309175 [Ascobolus immersus RN42]|uniref:Uncharacterized protein n=1 Tax=Ascobolus immersus RN42 TaxID=1160509 RepID=A0A3N4I368_ASCIM|nr:hypothetical protein BJ508DRAFT_309175 [Ascobolus immersus RN42]